MRSRTKLWLDVALVLALTQFVLGAVMKGQREQALVDRAAATSTAQP